MPTPDWRPRHARSLALSLNGSQDLWHTGSDSNTHLAVLETAALPIELPAYVKGRRGRALPALEGIEPIATNQTFLDVSLSPDHSLAASSYTRLSELSADRF